MKAKSMTQVVKKATHKGGAVVLTKKELRQMKQEARDNFNSECLMWRNMLGLMRQGVR